MPATSPCFLLDGPLMTAIERRTKVIEAMARDLADTEVLFDERETVRFLHAKGYPPLDIAILAGEARALALQAIVAQEMKKP